MDSNLLKFFADMRMVRRKLKELHKQYEYCGIVFFDVNLQTILFTGKKLQEIFENPNSRILQSCNFDRIEEFVKNFYETEESQGRVCPYDFTNIKVEDEKGSYWVQLYILKWKLSRAGNLAGIIWIKLEEKSQEQEQPVTGDYQIQEGQISDKNIKDTQDNYLFAWNIVDDRVLLSENWTRKFNAHNPYKRVNGQMIEWYIMKEDIPKFHKLQSDIMRGESPEDILLRFYVKDDKYNYAWCNVSFLSIFCDEKVPIYVVGRVREIEKLSSRCSGNNSIYISNRREARQKIDEFLAERESSKIHGLLVIRLNMKEETKNEETFWGESVISYTFAQNLAYMIDPTDIPMVHDNYMVIFLGDMGKEENVLRKAAGIHKVFERIRPERLYAEMGVALWPKDGKTFEELLTHAEKPMNIMVNCLASDLTREGSVSFGEVDLEQETVKRGERWPISVVSDIMDEWYHMIYINSRLKRQMELAESQIMLGQLNPHFIFNALANIKALIYIDSGLAEKLIVAFTKYLRTHLNALGKEEMTPIREILEYVDNYIQVEQSRFPGKFKVNYEIQYDNFRMPYFIIQPLVENAIKHGLCKKNGEGNLRIASYLTGNDICIEIEDDGVGFDRMQERTIYNGIGIENVRKRIAYLLDGSLVLSSELGKGTKVVIKFRERRV